MRIKGRISQIITKDKIEGYMLPYDLKKLGKHIINIESLECPKGRIKRIMFAFKNRKKTWYWSYVCDNLPKKGVGDIIEVEVNPLFRFTEIYVDGAVTDFTKSANADFPSGSLICVKLNSQVLLQARQS